ncbi:Aste57867_2635 [Aphanomyces stellatus]|uniref:Aste57867_2635 protein n=1 Tax=Aphanomyces stellatus TaxID=120398 RepID=A0A485K8Q2_9STRA|nr:hypothetical protein As57867_002628 [Aphanomyces stellatus]VFT79831.1 Aste57867_2635 [Aphanomyces stellatus]
MTVTSPAAASTGPTPVWALVVLAMSILTMSSGGVWFALLDDTPPLMQACWRLTLTVVLQAIGVAYELRTDPSLDAAFWIRYRQSVPLILTIGASLAAYFGSWGWSVAHTSLLDSLLLVCTTPLLLVVIMTLRWLYRRHCRHQSSRAIVKVSSESDYLVRPDATTSSSWSISWFETIVCPQQADAPTWLELLGTVVGFSGVLTLLAAGGGADANAAANSHDVTFLGNASALLGALVIIAYLEGGAACRKWMPLFIYSFSVTSCAAIYLAVASLVLEPETTVLGLGPAALFGFVGEFHRFGLVFGAAFVAGFFGHACMNIAVVHVSTLLIAVCALSEPLLGSVMGYLVGVQGPPDQITLFAAPLLLGGALLVTLSGHVITKPPQAADPVVP